MAADVYDRVFEMAKRRGFLYPSFEIYGGAAGFYDYGPLGAAFLQNVANLWREFYVVREGCAEISAPAVTPEEVFIASGHVGEFTDLMTKCEACGTPFRADHLVEGAGFEGKVDTHKPESVDAVIRELKVRCPTCGGALGRCFPQNLMFGTEIGPGTRKQGYLRPETAQAMFIDFHLLYRYFRETLPFGVVQLGRGYRNEISPRQGVIRLREFNMMEAEVFVDPAAGKTHPRYERVAGRTLRLVPNTTETETEMTLREAVDRKLIANRALAYYLALTHEFLVAAGLDPKRIHFRQHLKTEMAHYANDCWDAEFQSERFGWVECVGIADRSAYDLTAHSKRSGVALDAMRPFETPREVEVVRVVPAAKVLGPLFKKEATKVADALKALDPGSVREGRSLHITVDGREFEVPANAFKVERAVEKQVGERFTPHVIEPSYGLDRICYASLEHNFREEAREVDGAKETYRRLTLPARVSPVKVGIFPLVSKDRLPEVARDAEERLKHAGLVTGYDESGSIGRRYARMDEIGTPFCVTIDFESLEGKTKGTVTVRDRDSQKQVRVAIDALAAWVAERLRLAPSA